MATANIFLNLPAPAGNAAGAAVDVSTMGALKSIVVQGVWPKPQKMPVVNIEMNNAAVATDGSWAPVCTFYGTGIQTVLVAARWMRARVSNYNAGAAPAVNVGGLDDGSVFANLVAPAGNGVGAAVDISSLPPLKTLQIGRRFSGSIILELSEDAAGTRWAQWEAMQAPGQQTQTAVAYWGRLKRVGVPTSDPYGAPIVNLGASLPSSNTSTGVNVQDEGVPVVTPATTLNFTGGVVVTDAGGGQANIDISTFQTLRFSPMAPSQWGPTANMPTGIIDNYTDPSLTTHSFLWFKGADNEATRLSGIDATGLQDGDVRLFLNLPAPASGIDSSPVILLDKINPDAAGSAAANQFICPGHTNYTVPFGGHVWLIRAPTYPDSLTSCWHILGQNAWTQKSIIQSLNFYPNLQIGSPGAPISGNLNDWNPVGLSPYGVGPAFGLAGSDLRFNDHTVLRCFVDAAGATVTGMLVESITEGPIAYGPVKVLVNEGPGNLTIAHLSGLSALANRIYCPNSRDLIVPSNAAVWLMHMYPNTPDAGIQWRVLGLGNEVFPSVNTDGKTTTRNLNLTPALTPAAIASLPAVTEDLNVGGHTAVAILTANANGSILGGIDAVAAGLADGDLFIIRNAGSNTLIILNESAGSAVGNRFRLPGNAPMVIAVRGQEAFRYEGGFFRPLSNAQTLPLFELAYYITPTVLAAANIDDWSPVDATTGMPFSYVGRIKSQGSVGTVLRTMDPPAGAGNDGFTIMLMNYSSAYTIKHAAAVTATGKPFNCPGGVDYIMRTFSATFITYDAVNNIWHIIAP